MFFTHPLVIIGVAGVAIWKSRKRNKKKTSRLWGPRRRDVKVSGHPRHPQPVVVTDPTAEIEVTLAAPVGETTGEAEIVEETVQADPESPEVLEAQ